MAAETNLTPGTVKNARERLGGRKILIVEHHRAAVPRNGWCDRFRVCHYRIDWDRLCEAYLDGGGDFPSLEGDGADRHVREQVEALGKRERSTRRGMYEAARRKGDKSTRAAED